MDVSRIYGMLCCDDIRESIEFMWVLLRHLGEDMKSLTVVMEKECTLREREKHYISSSHLGLIRCLTPFRVRISTIASI